MKEYGPVIPNHILLFTSNCKGCKRMYNLLLDKKRETCTSIPKWRENGHNYAQETWHKIFELPFKSTQESKLHWLQFQILHRIVPTNKYLFKIKKAESPVCTFCKRDEESIGHLFYECTIVKELWSAVEDWILRQSDL